jgi:hypothetical protein
MHGRIRWAAREWENSPVLPPSVKDRLYRELRRIAGAKLSFERGNQPKCFPQTTDLPRFVTGDGEEASDAGGYGRDRGIPCFE